MSKVLFLSLPSHGNVNPTLGLVSELVKQGEEVIYFCSDAFKVQVEATGAVFKNYAADLDIFKIDKDFKPGNPRSMAKKLTGVLQSGEEVIADILEQIKDQEIDYLAHSAAFPFTKAIAQILEVPTVSSLAIFAGLKKFMEKGTFDSKQLPPGAEEMMQKYQQIAQNINERFGVAMPQNILEIIFNKGDISLVYTSKYFASDLEYFDDTFKFVGPPIFQRKEDLDFPFEQLQGKKVVYISLGTVFSNYDINLYEIFFEAFGNMDAVVVMAAYNVDLTPFTIPTNFIVRNHVPQSELLKYTNVAITHAGMNSISDLVSANIPFISIPLGADQPELARRAVQLGATISLDASTLDAKTLRDSVEKVLYDPAYLENIKKINESFVAAGGYKKAVEEIFELKRRKGI